MNLKKAFVIILIIAFFQFMNAPNVCAVQPQSEPKYEGIDVSNWQGYIDYAQVKNSGIQVVYIKASQGTNLKDAYFDINYENAKQNGLKVGFYHFLVATNVQEAEAEAKRIREEQKKRAEERRSRTEKKYNWSTEPVAQDSDDEWFEQWKKGNNDRPI